MVIDHNLTFAPKFDHRDKIILLAPCWVTTATKWEVDNILENDLSPMVPVDIDQNLP